MAAYKVFRRLMVGVGFLVLMVAWQAIGADAQEALATVNGEQITKEALVKRLLRYHGTQTLDDMINEALISQEAGKRKIAVTKEEIDARIEQMRRDLGENFRMRLAQQNLTPETLPDKIKFEILLEKMVSDRVKISEEEVKGTYEQNKEAFYQPELIRLSQIMVSTEKQAKELKGRIKQGENFGTLAKQYSKDEVSRARGGDLGYLQRGVLPPELAQVAFKLQVNETSDPIKIDNDWYLLLLTEKRAAKQLAFEEVKDGLSRRLFLSKLWGDAVPGWFAEIKEKAAIDREVKKFD